MTHLCSLKMTDTKNAMWRRQAKSTKVSSRRRRAGFGLVSSAPDAYKALRCAEKWPSPSRNLLLGQFGARQVLPNGPPVAWKIVCPTMSATTRWVIFGKQPRVNFRECRSTYRHIGTDLPLDGYAGDLAAVLERTKRSEGSVDGRLLIPENSTCPRDTVRYLSTGNFWYAWGMNALS